MSKPLPGRYIIYADDDKDDQQMLIDAFHVIDPTINFVTVENGLAVMQWLSGLDKSASLPEGVILDINMPIWDGLRTLRALKDDPRFNMIPVCMLTGADTKRDGSVSEGLGAKAFFTKPVSDAELVTIAKQMMLFWK